MQTEPAGRDLVSVPRESSRRAGSGFVAPVVLGLGLGIPTAVLLNGAWDECGVPLPAVHWLVATCYGIATALLAGGVYFLLTAPSQRTVPSQMRGPRAATIAAFVLVAMLAYFQIAGALPGSFQVAFYPHSNICPGDAPSWWPSWMPV